MVGGDLWWGNNGCGDIKPNLAWEYQRNILGYNGIRWEAYSMGISGP
jgi:hypothetical protein